MGTQGRTGDSCCRDSAAQGAALGVQRPIAGPSPGSLRAAFERIVGASKAAPSPGTK
jgi:hypothetical protein